MPVLARYQIISQYVTDLKSLTGYYLGYIPQQYADQPTQDGAWSIILNDPAVSHCSNMLSLMVAGEYIELKCEHPTLQKIIGKFLSTIQDFTHARKSLSQMAMLMGLGVQKKIYIDKIFHAWPGLTWRCVDRLLEVDRRRMRIERDDNSKNEWYWTIWDPRYDKFMILEDKKQLCGMSTYGLSIQDFIWYFYELEELNPYYKGFADQLYTLCYIKKFVIQYWADLAENWAKPMALWYIDAAKGAIDAVLGSGFTTATDRIKTLLNVVEAARARHCIVAQKGADEITWQEHGSTGNNIIKELLEYCDSKITLLLLGSELTTSTPSTGSYALGAIHRGELQSIIMYNRIRLQEVLLRDLVYEFLIDNRKNLYVLGIRIPDVDEISFKIKVEGEEMKKQEDGNGDKEKGGAGGNKKEVSLGSLGE